MTKNKAIETSFQAAAVVLCLAAVYFWSEGNWDRTYLSAVFGCLCFFLSIRFQVKERIRLRAEEQARELPRGDGFTAADSEFERTREQSDNQK